MEALAARGAAEAPLMRELERVEGDAPLRAELPAAVDLCVRAVFAASSPVRARLTDASGAVRGEAVVERPSGAVPVGGPACARKGESLRLEIEAAGPSGDAPPAGAVRVRAIVFAAP
jgi:hypothetical protein